MVLPKQKGQILLIVILVIIVASTVGLSLASRSITSLRSSTEEAESQKALAAAEAGIERTIQGSIPIAVQGSNPSNNSSYTTQFTSVNGAIFLMNGDNLIPKDEGADLWLSTYSSVQASNYGSPWTGDLTVYWGNSSTACNNSALEIIIVLGPKNNPVLKKYAYDPCPTRQSENHFSVPAIGGTIVGKTFYYKATISSISSALIARIIPIYGDTYVGIQGSVALPLQGYKIDSIGTSGQASRKITVFKGYPQTYLPYLSYGLFVAN